MWQLPQSFRAIQWLLLLAPPREHLSCLSSKAGREFFALAAGILRVRPPTLTQWPPPHLASSNRTASGPVFAGKIFPSVLLNQLPAAAISGFHLADLFGTSTPKMIPPQGPKRSFRSSLGYARWLPGKSSLA